MTVHLVGAGCGTPSWLTLRGAELLRTAEAVVYDRLIHPDLLQLCPRECEYHPAGKRESDHTLPQKEINALLVEWGNATPRCCASGVILRLRDGVANPCLEEEGSPGTRFRALPPTPAAAPSVLPADHRGLSGAGDTRTGRLGTAGNETTHATMGKIPGPRRTSSGTSEPFQGTLCLYMCASSFAEAAPFRSRLTVTPVTPGAA